MEVVEGKDVTIIFDGKRCIHARRCVMGAPSVFVANVKGDWIHPDAVPADEVMRIALNCPSGAIRAERKDGGRNEQPPPANTVMVRENGPLAFNGGPTQTRALMAGSPAINNGSNPAMLAFDQRGNTRSVGQTDIGAFEVQAAPAKVASVVINGGDAQRSMVTKVQVNFNQHIGFTTSAAAAFSLTRVGDNSSVNLAASVDDSGSGTVVSTG